MVASSPLQMLQAYLKDHPKTQVIACQLITYGNANCTRFLTLPRALEIAKTDPSARGYISVPSAVRTCLSSGQMLLDQMALFDDHWVPDWSTIHPCATNEEQANVMVHVLETFRPEPEWEAYDPRAILRKIENKAKSMGIELLVGYEVEFYFLDTVESIHTIPTPAVPFFTSAANRTKLYPIILECVKAIEAANIGVWGFHTVSALTALGPLTLSQEGVPSKWEISLRPFSPLKAVDNIVYIHEVIKDITNKHGLHVTFHPQAFPKRITTAGQHAHISINGPKVTPAVSDSFLAGMLDGLQATTAFLFGGLDSYGNSRGLWTGQGPVMWSVSKFAPIRRFDPGNHYEVRLGDTLANAYLQLAAVLATGLHGITSQCPLTTKAAHPRSMFTTEPPKPEDLESWGVTKWLPKTFGEALDELEKEAGNEQGALRGLLGEHVLRAYITFKRAELQHQSGMEQDARRIALISTI